MNGDIFYFSIISAALLLSAMGLWFTAVIPGIDRWSKRFFLRYFIVFMLCCASGCAEMVLWYHPVPIAAAYFVLISECLILSLPLPMLTIYLLHCCGESIRASSLLRAVLGLWAVYAVLLISSPFIGGFTYITSISLYERGPLYPLLLLPLVAAEIFNLAGAIRRRKRLSHKVFLSFLIAILPMTLALTIQMLADMFPLLDISYVLSALSMYGLILSDQIEQYLRQQQVIANQRTEIMLSQIQPHFLYNTLGAIGYLCRDNPEAKAAVNKFARYLQGNMDSLSQTEPIPFATELEHTKAYLELERLRFREKLNVVYDLEATEFLLPTLTLQPLVENAVFHGVRGNPDGRGTVTVSSREYPDRYEITVADDGPGFDPDATPRDDGEAHIGIENVRARLLRQVGGTLRVDSTPGQGCRMTIKLPKEAGTC